MFTVAVTVVAALLFGLMRDRRARVRPGAGLRQSGAAQPRSRRAFGNGLLVAQVAAPGALSVSQLSIAHLRHLRDRSSARSQCVLLISINTSRAQNRQQLAALYRDIVPAWRRFRGVCDGCGERDDADCPRRSEPLPAGRRIRRTRAGQAAGVAEFGVSQLFATYGTPLLAGRTSATLTPKSRARHRQPGAGAA
jgi:hypothetical protein